MLNTSTSTYPGVYVEELPATVRSIYGERTSVAAFIGRALKGPVKYPQRIYNFEHYKQIFGGLWKPSNMSYAVYQYFQNGGREALIVRIAQNENGTLDDDGGPFDNVNIDVALSAFNRADIFSFLCIPPFNPKTNTTPTSIYVKALTYLEKEKKRAILIIDPPQDWKRSYDPIGKMGVNNSDFLKLHNKNAVVYFPRLLANDPLENNNQREFVPCGAVAGIFARTDSVFGVWKSPAGIEATLRGVSDLTVTLSDKENDELNAHGINCLRVLPRTGAVVWGARTMHGLGRPVYQWKYIGVRRLAMFIEESLYRGTQWVVFEPNDERLWSQIRLNLNRFMNGMYKSAAFQGKTPNEAYFVKCDSETTSQMDIRNGVINIVVGFAPLKPAEFVIIQIQQMMKGGGNNGT
jgi:uncharacterized protein